MRAHRNWMPNAKGRREPKITGQRQSAGYSSWRPSPMIYRERPGTGFRHLLLQRDIEAFTELLPDWSEVSRGLRAIVLAWGEPGLYGWHEPGVLAICAWEVGTQATLTSDVFEPSRALIERLQVPYASVEGGFRCLFTEETARAFQLLDVFLHELGHHHDRMTTRRQRDCCRGEPFAEEYARRHGALIWTRYTRAFGL